MAAQTCDYCGHSIKEYHFKSVRCNCVIEERASPPVGARNLNIIKSVQKEINFTGEIFRQCDYCGGVWKEIDSDRNRFESVEPSVLINYAKHWLELAIKPGAEKHIYRNNYRPIDSLDLEMAKSIIS